MSLERKMEVAREILGGQRLFGSKGQYRSDNPDNVVVFNGNIVTKEGEKIWYGDLDLTANDGQTERQIRRLAAALNTRVYVLYEMDARFENETNPQFENAVYSTDGEDAQHNNYIVRSGGILQLVKALPLSEQEKLERAKNLRESYNKEEYTRVVATDEEGEDNVYIGHEDMLRPMDDQTSPLHHFWDIVQEVTGLKGEEALSKVWITKETSETLRFQTELWYRLYHGYFETDYRVKSNMGWLWLSHGPCEFQETPEWADEGSLYIRTRIDN